ncbi:hypothetical protein [Paenibacillus durus]|uniref:hypothetical protein n=1 Tax=Paenibacillus durus TaxID=44251 RepID=UPI0012E0A0FB|nr:hypothetical protein [Paenibacillus durus]
MLWAGQVWGSNRRDRSNGYLRRSVYGAWGVADIAEGVQDYYYVSKGGTQTPTFNFVRDTLFNRNEEAYRMSMDISLITGGLAAEIVVPTCYCRPSWVRVG